MESQTRPPFLYGGPIPPALSAFYFHGFEEERRRVGSFLTERAPARFGIFGDAASGKTSLVMAVASRSALPRRYVECTRTWPSTRAAFYRNLLEALDLVNAPFDVDQPAIEAYRTLPVPKKGTIGELVLENAHALAEVDQALLDELPVLSARLPFHLIVTGQEEHLRKICPEHVLLHPFSESTTVDFLERRFAAVNLRAGLDACQSIYEFSGGRPDAVQRIGSIVWERAQHDRRRAIDRADVDLAIADAVERLPTYALAGWASVRGLMRDIFIAMCLFDLQAPTEIAKRLELEPKNVVVLLGRLESVHGLVTRVERGRYAVRDALLKHYVRKEWGSPVLR